MAQRILIAELKQETATFNPEPTRYDDFSIYRGADIVDAFSGTETELAGALSVLTAAGCDIVPTVAATAVSGGPIPTGACGGSWVPNRGRQTWI